MDPLPLAQALIRRASVTPADDGAQAVLVEALTALGFRVTPLRFGAIDNLIAHRPGHGARLAFAGHTDVVPSGPAAQWSAAPFAAELRDGRLIGRGAADMKGAIAAFVAAAARSIAAGHDGELLLVIAGDEEGDAEDGTVKLMPWLADHGLLPEAAITGEPTSAARVGDTIKIGRRGSTNMALTVTGRQGHVAYPDRADNPITALARIVTALKADPLDFGVPGFDPSNLEVTGIEAGEGANNVIPGTARARINVRFNPSHSCASLEAHVRAIAARYAPAFTLSARCSGEAFVTEPGPLTDALAAAAAEVTGSQPQLSTSGGTSDARFIRRWCPVAELGLVGATMHQIDEHVPVADIEALTRIYEAFLRRWFA
ncbi:MAG: succinyl-diaminopimelate desuccinylase [Sphingomonadaceae bacterium]|nr:succinyl-diaminopimelate desuccinylase [Sphingomonadaceae bacterium]